MLEPLTPSLAEEMAEVMADPSLYVHTGGAPPTAATLRARYERQAAGASPDGTEAWLNWVVRRADTRAAVGFVQATIDRRSGVAELAWVIGAPFQRNGFAVEASQAAIAWLCGRADVTAVTAHVAPANVPSARVAERLGLRPSARVHDGEVVWESDVDRLLAGGSRV